jgi:hypothetical protein
MAYDIIWHMTYDSCKKPNDRSDDPNSEQEGGPFRHICPVTVTSSVIEKPCVIHTVRTLIVSRERVSKLENPRTHNTIVLPRPDGGRWSLVAGR